MRIVRMRRIAPPEPMVGLRLKAVASEGPDCRPQPVGVGDAKLPWAIETLAAIQKLGHPWAAGHQRLHDGELEIDLFPNRPKMPPLRDDHGGDCCPFCQPLPPKVPELGWRGYRFIPNLAPYVAGDGMHILVSALEHRPQSTSVGDLGSMIELSRSAGRPVTLHFNGLAGNTQYHFHWHLTTERLPLERALRRGELPKARIRKNAQIEISHYGLGVMRGILLEGTPSAVQRWSAEIVRRLEADPRSLGRYNLLLLPVAGDRVTLAIVPRRFLGEGVEHDHSAFTYAGRFFCRASNLEDVRITEGRASALAELLDPSQIEWLEAIRRAPEPAIVELLARAPRP